jgi:hypothetical protein
VAEQPGAGASNLQDNWQKLSPAGAGSPSVVLNAVAGGRDEVFALDGSTTLWQHTAAGWAQINAGVVLVQLSATQDASGVDQVFGTLSDGALVEYSPLLPGNHFRQLLSGGVISTSTPRRPGF